MMVLKRTCSSITVPDRSYIAEISLDKQISLNEIAWEKILFSKKKKELLNNSEFYGKYVAVKNGEIIDSDVDQDSLLKRVYKKLGYVQILIEKIEKEELEYTTSPIFDIS